MSSNDKFLGEFEQMVMLSLIQLADEAYGAAIRQLLAERVERNVAIGALYSTLDRLERKGMVTSRLGEATAQRGGRPKRYFKVTAQGTSELNRARQAMNTLWDGIQLSPNKLKQGLS